MQRCGLIKAMRRERATLVRGGCDGPRSLWVVGKIALGGLYLLPRYGLASYGLDRAATSRPASNEDYPVEPSRADQLEVALTDAVYGGLHLAFKLFGMAVMELPPLVGDSTAFIVLRFVALIALHLVQHLSEW